MYLKIEQKDSKRSDHVADDVMSLFWSCEILSGRTLASCKTHLSTALGLVSRLFRSCSLPP